MGRELCDGEEVCLFLASTTTQRVVLLMATQVNLRTPVQSAMLREVSDHPNREGSLQVQRWCSVCSPSATWTSS